MVDKDYLRGKKVTVVGLGRSGFAAARLALDRGASVSITDIFDTPQARGFKSQLAPYRIACELGRHSPDFITGRDLVVVSPGVKNSSPAVVLARRHNIPVISEIELGWMFCPAAVIAVTGSTGKTTVTTLISRVLAKNGSRVFACGNIGDPFCGEIGKIKPGDFVCLEVSSFQLENVRTFKPKIAVVLNFSRNHLDWHRNIGDYLAAKQRIFINQDTSDFSVFNRSDPLVKAMAAKTPAQAVYFSESQRSNANYAAVLAVAGILGVKRRVCLDVFGEFHGIEHRLEYVKEVNGVKFINDSKSTTVASLLWALKNVLPPVVLIAGGRDKGNDYRLVRQAAVDRIKYAVFIGEAKQKMRQALGDCFDTEEALTLEEAVNKAFARAETKDSVLFSPMCASFDMFADYQDRGEKFKQAVFDLAGSDLSCR